MESGCYFTMDKTRISAQMDLERELADLSVNPRLQRALEKWDATITDYSPVDTYNPNIVDPSELVSVGSLGRTKNRNQVTKAKSVNLLLRAAFAALAEIHLQSQKSQLSFVTVNLSRSESARLAYGGGAASYGKKLKRRFAERLKSAPLQFSQKPDFFLVLEDSSDGSLHSHIIMRHHPDDVPELDAMLRKDTEGHGSAVRFQTDFRLWLDAAPGSLSWQVNELELEEYPDLCSYPLLGVNRHGQERFYRIQPVDAGAADYISKELELAIKGNPEANRLFIEGRVKTRARQIYTERYALKRMRKQRARLESKR